MSAIPISKGDRFGCLVVLERVPNLAKDGSRFYLCQCDCGGLTKARGTHLNSGHTRSCGHLHQETLKIIHATNLGADHPSFKHGHCVGVRARVGKRIPEYDCWDQMIQRCTNPTNKRFHQYAGVGVKVCGRWRNSFEAFLEDVGPRPSSKHSLSSYLDTGNYEPGNVEWGTQADQGAEAKGKTAMLAWHNRKPLSWYVLKNWKLQLSDYPKPTLISVSPVDAEQEVA